MIKSKSVIYLASKSPRRKKLLKQLGLKFKTLSVDIDEEFQDGEHPVRTVKRIANEKMNVASHKIKNGIIITADTIVVIDKKIIGKPRSKKEAFKFLEKLSGRTHAVYTGFVVFNKSNGKKISGYERTQVTFRDLSEKEIEDYVKTGSPLDKAGAYGIQDDYGAVFIKKINGCYNNVVGLPLSKIYAAIKEILSK